MSFGSISKEAHETLAIAMNRLGGMSNTGEGGEDEARFTRDANGDSRRSAVKQVASGRFGVTTNYLVNADELQIKMAQGAKPGEGGQLPGHKVDEVIARMRHSIPGVGLISPPPHHDIYSIEDLAQLIYDLKNVNPQARIAVKLVAEVGVGTVAAGVAKAHADVVLISGDTGGTGASPLSSIKHAGTALGTRPRRNAAGAAAERSAQPHPRADRRQAADRPRRRDRRAARRRGIRLRHRAAHRHGLHHDAQVPPEHLLGRHRHAGPGAARALHRPARARHQFLLLHRRAGARSTWPSSASAPWTRWSAASTSSIPCWPMRTGRPRASIFSSILYAPDGAVARCAPLREGAGSRPRPGARSRADRASASRHSSHKQPVEAQASPIRNVHRTVGAMLGGEIARRYGSAGLPDDTIHFKFNGSAGQSFGAFVPNGVTLELEGEANDYLGKGLSGGRIIAYPPKTSSFLPEESILVGNVVLYGATSGEVFLNGIAGERFAVRNSGATRWSKASAITAANT